MFWTQFKTKYLQGLRTLWPGISKPCYIAYTLRQKKSPRNHPPSVTPLTDRSTTQLDLSYYPGAVGAPRSTSHHRDDGLALQILLSHLQRESIVNADIIETSKRLLLQDDGAAAAAGNASPSNFAA